MTTVRNKYTPEIEARAILKALKNHGLELVRVFDSEEWNDVPAKQADQIELITCTDELTLRVADSAAGKRYSVGIVWGNEPGVAIYDHTAVDVLDLVRREVNDKMERRFGG